MNANRRQEAAERLSLMAVAVSGDKKAINALLKDLNNE
jgi:hypothetical protein